MSKVTDLLKQYLGASYLTTIFGLIASVFGYLALLGPNLPTTLQGWAAAIFAGALAWWGVKTKANNVSNAPVPAVAAIVVESPALVAKMKAAPVPTRKIKETP
jgi:hypothetical protein